MQSHDEWRDALAGLAMQGIIAAGTCGSVDETFPMLYWGNGKLGFNVASGVNQVAELAYKMADAMLAEREKKSASAATLTQEAPNV